jgi:single-stranded DNA-binding protein
MQKLIITGKLSHVEEPQKAEKSETRYQQIHINVKEFDRDTGEEKSSSFFPVTIFNNKIETINAKAMKGKVVECTAFLNANERETEQGKKYHALSLSCYEMKLKK